MRSASSSGDGRPKLAVPNANGATFIVEEAVFQHTGHFLVMFIMLVVLIVITGLNRGHAFGCRHAQPLESGSIAQPFDPAFEAEAVHHQHARTLQLAGIRRGRLIDV